MTQQASPRSEKGTTVRSLVDSTARWWIPALARLSPALAGRSALRLFATPPPPRPVSPRARAVLDRADAFSIQVGGRRVQVWAWGRGPSVHLVHGWGGRASQLTSFVEPIVESGYRVVAFDAPGHGDSGGGESSLFDFAAVLRALVALGGARAHAIVGHSLGAAAAVHALERGLAADRLVLLAPPADPARWLVGFLDYLGATPEMARSTRRLFAEAHGLGRIDLPLAERVTPGLPLLVVHDRADAEISWRSGAAIARAWPASRLLSTEGLGHHRVLRDEQVIESVAAFVAGARPETIAEPAPAWIDGICAQPRCARPVVDDGYCLEHLVTHEVAHPHTRWAA